MLFQGDHRDWGLVHDLKGHVTYPSAISLGDFLLIFRSLHVSERSSDISDLVSSLLIWVAGIALEGLQIMIVIVGVTNGHQE